MKFMRLKEVAEKTGMAKSTIDLMVSTGEFPAFIKTSPKVKVWVESDINNWMKDKVEESKKD